MYVYLLNNKVMLLISIMLNIMFHQVPSRTSIKYNVISLVIEKVENFVFLDSNKRNEQAHVLWFSKVIYRVSMFSLYTHRVKS